MNKKHLRVTGIIKFEVHTELDTDTLETELNRAILSLGESKFTEPCEPRIEFRHVSLCDCSYLGEIESEE